MSQRDSELLWLQDTLEHLVSCRQQLLWVRDPSSIHYLTETMLRDLDACRRLISRLHRKAALQSIN